MIRVGVSGAAGRMGRIVAETVAGQPDLELHGMYDPVGQDLAVAGMPIATDPGRTRRFRRRGRVHPPERGDSKRGGLARAGSTCRGRHLRVRRIEGRGRGRFMDERFVALSHRSQLLGGRCGDDPPSRAGRSSLRCSRDHRTPPRSEGRCSVGNGIGDGAPGLRRPRGANRAPWSRSNFAAELAAPRSTVSVSTRCGCPACSLISR